MHAGAAGPFSSNGGPAALCLSNIAYYGRQTFIDNLFSDPFKAHQATFQKYPLKPVT
jgi:hypothetical protein